MTSADTFLLQLAVEHGLVPAPVLAEIRHRVASAAGGPGATTVIDVLERDGVVSRRRLADALARELRLVVVDVTSVAPSPEAVALVPRELAERHRVVPLERTQEALVVASEDPLDLEAIERLAAAAQLRLDVRVTPLGSVGPVLARCYEASSRVAPSASEAKVPPGVDAPARPLDAGGREDAPVIVLVQEVIADAVRRGASDIHWEPLGRRLRLRYRVDGVLTEAPDPPLALQPALITRLKLMARLSIAEKRLPQDGRIRFSLPGRSLDLRVSVLPTLHGESVVMRLLDQEGLRLDLAEVGLWPDDVARLRQLLDAPDGIILVTGPTGSGKTTTLYSCLQHLNRPDRKIITVEDPVEYQLAGVNQVPVRPEVGMTFGAALRAMLRQSPNVILVGEIRDAETAEIALHAALTGHLVFSSLHTNDAVGAVTRLVDLGVKRFQVAGAVRVVLAQRLVRRVCACCAGSGQAPADGPCTQCGGSGFRGRLGLFEVLTVDDHLQQLIHEGVPEATLRRVARERGLRTLREDGLRKAAAGLTTPAEVSAVTVDEQS